MFWFQDEFQTFLKAAGCKLVVVEFSAKWCGPCKRMCPLIQAMSRQYQNVMFANVDVDESQDLAQTCNIKIIPTFQMFKKAQKTIEMRSNFTTRNKTQSFSIVTILDQIILSPLCIYEQIFEMCGADAKKLEMKIQELM
ncbi:thioredoxin domain-containing protein 8-like [Trichechus inunguis]